MKIYTTINIFILFYSALFHTTLKFLRIGYLTLLHFFLLFPFRTVPTQEQILVPETLLKKRKTQEKAQAEKLAAAKERKEVRASSLLYLF